MKLKSRTVKVTKRHIKKGNPTSPSSCPIALAIIDAYGDDVSGVEVDETIITFSLVRRGKLAKGIEEYCTIFVDLPTTKQQSKFIELFDEGGLVKPFSFKLPL